MNKVLSFLMIMLLVLLCACRTNAVSPSSAEGSANSKTYNVGKFNSVEVMNTIKVKYSQGNTTKVQVTADNQSFEYLKVKCTNGKLEIYFDVPKSVSMQVKDGKIYFNHMGKTIGGLSAEVELASPELNSITAYNSVDFEALTPLKGNKLNITAFNSADIELDYGVKVAQLQITAYNSADIEVKNLESEGVSIDAFNSADVELSGQTNTVNFSAYNSADIDAEKLKAGSGSASAFNSAEINCNVGRLNASKFNGGKIKNVR